MNNQIYIDESGYTGNNLLDKTQKYFILASINISEVSAKDIIIQLKRKYRLQGIEFKGHNLFKHKNGQKAMSDLLKKNYKII